MAAKKIKSNVVAKKGEWFVLRESEYQPNKVFIFRDSTPKYKLEKQERVIAVSRELNVIRLEAEAYYKNRIKLMQERIKEIEEYVDDYKGY